jgi:hypothetical protein
MIAFPETRAPERKMDRKLSQLRPNLPQPLTQGLKTGDAP